MPSSTTLKGLLVGGFVLLGIGLERLLNAYLIGSQAANFFTRLLISVLCVAAGSLLLAVTLSLTRHRRR